MTGMVLSGVLLGLGCSMPDAFASASCGLIRNLDKRAECYAISDRSPISCYSIKNSDDRALCQARADRRR